MINSRNFFEISKNLAEGLTNFALIGKKWSKTLEVS